MIKHSDWEVDDESAGMRLDRFIVLCIPSSTRALITEAVGQGQILVNGRKAVKAGRLQKGDHVTVSELMEASDIFVKPNPAIPLEVVYEDNDLLVINKPAGIPVHPVRYTETNTLANGLIARYPALTGIGDDPLFPALVHRIDTATSGLVIAAKNQKTFDLLRSQFSSRRVTKIYFALVHGRIEKPCRLENLLIHDPKKRGRMLVADENMENLPSPQPACNAVASAGKLVPRPVLRRDSLAKAAERRFRAVSDIGILKQWKNYSLVSVTIKTGVTHQIRCQLAHHGYPIVGDSVYGSKRINSGSLLTNPPAALCSAPARIASQSDVGGLRAGRHFLHAFSIELTHPATGERVSFQAEMPLELERVLSGLGWVYG